MTDWFFLVLSVIVAAVGIALAVIFRPHESLRELRREITAAKGTRGDAASTQEES